MDHKRKLAEYILGEFIGFVANRTSRRREKDIDRDDRERRAGASRLVATALPVRKTSGLFYGAVKYDLGFN